MRGFSFISRRGGGSFWPLVLDESVPAATAELSPGAYASQLKQLLPRGVLWNLEEDSNISKTLIAIGDELSRVDARGIDLIDETDPRTAYETLEDWERVLALPDERVTAIPGSVAERRVAITQKFASRGGQSISFFTALALSCGYVVTIARTAVLRVGFRVGARVYGDNWAYSMIVTVVSENAGALSHADFERVIRHAAHSHITVGFTY